MTAATNHASATLAEYALSLRIEDLPRHVRKLAEVCLTDAIACAVHGSRQPWSRMILQTTLASAAEGPCGLPGALPRGMPPGPAALCLGAFAHAFELDSLRKPGAGVHPGATVALPALAVAQACGASTDQLLAAIVAGCEVMFRIGDATLHTPEGAGFHAPGITGAFGSATAAAYLLGLDPERLARAYGICGSLSAGLLAFAKSGDGGMVKRLHLGRAAEAGVLAATLAANGFEGPLAVLEGTFGVLDAYCNQSDSARLTRSLGSQFEIEKLCMKRFACHVTAQAPVQLLRDLMATHGFSGPDIAKLTLVVPDKVLSHHNERAPRDLMLAQYSVPFAVALAAFRDPEDPSSFNEAALRDPGILALAKVIEVTGGRAKGWGADLGIRLVDGRRFDAAAEHFDGSPERPLTDAALGRKFRALTGMRGVRIEDPSSIQFDTGEDTPMVQEPEGRSDAQA